MFQEPYQFRSHERHAMAGHFSEAEDVADAPVESDPRELAIAVRSLHETAIVDLKIDENQWRGGQQSGVQKRVDFNVSKGRRAAMRDRGEGIAKQVDATALGHLPASMADKTHFADAVAREGLA